MKTISFNIAYCFLTMCSIFSLCLNLSFAQGTPTTTAIPTPTVTATTTVTATITATPTPQPPSVTTGDATGECINFVLTGVVNANGLLTTTWFEYGTVSGSYSGTSSTQSVVGANDTTVSMEIDVPDAGSYYELYNWCTGETTYFDNPLNYYYRIVAQNSAGISYGGENGFESVCYIIGDSWDCPCETQKIVLDPAKLSLKKKAIVNVTVTVTGEDGCAVEGETVTITLTSAGKRCLSVTPTSTNTDEDGQATFTITAKKKTGNARITFKVGSVKKTMVVRVGSIS